MIQSQRDLLPYQRHFSVKALANYLNVYSLSQPWHFQRLSFENGQITTATTPLLRDFPGYFLLDDQKRREQYLLFFEQFHLRSLLEFEVGRSNTIKLRPNQDLARIICFEQPKKPSSHCQLGYDILPCCSSEAMTSRLELSYFKVIYGREQPRMIAEMVLEGEPSGLVKLVYDYVKNGPERLN